MKKPVPVFNYAAHWLLWDWLMRNPRKSKAYWPGFKVTGTPFNYCFACAYAMERSNGFLNCDKCPFINTSNTSECLQGTFSLYTDAIVLDRLPDVQHYARIIRDWPLRECAVVKGLALVQKWIARREAHENC